MIRELRAAVTATAHMQAANSGALKDHAHRLVADDEALLSSREEHDRRMKELDERIANLVSGFGEFLRLDLH